MRIGAVLPQTEIGADPAMIREYAQAVEELGYTHILAYDHVLGADTSVRPGWSGPYTSATMFHEPFVLFGYLAALTRRVELVSGVIILPQRQTALVAKQAAEVDVLSGGRLRLGVGVGWNDVEYQGLNENFHNRGARSEEQIALLRALWAEPAITFRGKWHTLEAAGINPLPVLRSIPLWIGGYAEATLERVGRLGDGWFPWRPLDDKMRAAVERLRGSAHAAGRDPQAIGLEPQLSLRAVPQQGWAGFARGWRNLGATHLCVNTMGAGLASPRDHIEALRQVAHELAL
jgi:probable F420-dependent oxidoreductase